MTEAQEIALAKQVTDAVWEAMCDGARHSTKWVFPRFCDVAPNVKGARARIAYARHYAGQLGADRVRAALVRLGLWAPPPTAQ